MYKKMTEKLLIKFLNNCCTDEELDEVIRWVSTDALNNDSKSLGLHDWKSYQAGLDPVEIWTPESRPKCTKDILDSALEFIKENKEKPFYANVWLSDMHSTLNPSEEQLEKTKRFHPRRGVDFYGVDQIYFATN